MSFKDSTTVLKFYHNKRTYKDWKLLYWTSNVNNFNRVHTHVSEPLVSTWKSGTEGFGLRPKMCRPSANTENFPPHARKPMVPGVWLQPKMLQIILPVGVRRTKNVYCKLEVHIWTLPQPTFPHEYALSISCVFKSLWACWLRTVYDQRHARDAWRERARSFPLPSSW